MASSPRPTRNQKSGAASNVAVRRGLWVASGVLVAAAAYLGTASALADRIPAGTKIGAVDVGGMSRAQATAALDREIKKAESEPITVSAEGHKVTLVPSEAGVSVSTRLLTQDLTGFSLSPTTLLNRAFGSHHSRPLPIQVDQDQLQSALSAASSSLKGGAKDATVGYVNGAPQITSHAVDGLAFNTNAVASALRRQWPMNRTINATLAHSQPPVTDQAAQAWVDGAGQTAVSGPVQITATTHSVTITPAQIAEVAQPAYRGSTIGTTVDPKKFDALIKSVESGLAPPATNGRIIVSGDKKTYTAGSGGQELQMSGAQAAFVKAISSPDNRTVKLGVTTKPSPWTIDKLKSVRLDKVSTFEVYLPGGASNAARTKNIEIALSKINGTVVDKGQQFSLLEALGPLTPAAGYVDAPTIQNGVEVPGLGGGISQVSTTLYNAAFFAGVQLDEHVAHAFWIPRYPMGREATLWSGAIDNKWTNTTDGPIAVQAGVVHDDETGTDQVQITFLGTPTFQVQSTTGQPFAKIAPKTLEVHKPGCIPQSPQDGFTVVVTRVVTKNGTVVADQKFTTHYQAADRVICK